MGGRAGGRLWGMIVAWAQGVLLPQSPLPTAQYRIRRPHCYARAALISEHTHTRTLPLSPRSRLPCRLQYFSRVFRATKFSFLDSLKEVIHDIKYYLVFLALIL